MADRLEQTLRTALATSHAEVVGLERRTLNANNSLLAELCASRTGADVGLHRYALTRRDRRTGAIDILDLFVKAKPADSVLIAAGSELAVRCAPGLGDLYARYSPRRELGGSHLREAAVYRLDMPRVRPTMPAFHASAADAKSGLWVLVLEHLTEVEFLADMQVTDRWTTAHWHAAIDALADIHSQWFGREADVLAQPWIPANALAHVVPEMMEWWEALGDFCAPTFSDWLGIDARAQHEALLAPMPQWWTELAHQPRTLIHNDFNPRNLAFRITPAGPNLCAFDWELATLGVPQHDLAELLCFALPASADRAWVDALIERHRAQLERIVGVSLPPATWRRGLALSVDHLFIDRLPMYALIHQLRPLAYLPGVLRNWRRLHTWAHAD